MTTNFMRITAVVVFLVICGFSQKAVMGQQTSAQRNKPPGVIKYDGDMASLLSHLTPIFGVTVGLELEPKQPRPEVSIYLREPTLTDVLNAIVKSSPAYKWRESNGGIEVLPVEANNPLLDTMISAFSVSDVDQNEAVNRLLNLPDVQANLRAMRLNRIDADSATGDTKSEKFSLNLDRVTMRQALSEIANKSGGRFWIFRTPGDRFFSISNSPR
jgi:hypothetical protein